MDGVRIEVRNLDGVRAALLSVPDKLRRRAVSRALREAARIVRDEARRGAPVISRSAPAVLAGRRAPGTVRRAISVRTSKVERRRRNVGVFINVRPATGERRGKNNPRDPYYWRWLEFGWTTRDGRRREGFGFLRRAAVVIESVVPRFASALRRIVQQINAKAPVE